MTPAASDSAVASCAAACRKAVASAASFASARSNARLANGGRPAPSRSRNWLAAKAAKSCVASAANSGWCGCQVCTHISLAEPFAASRPARPAACISSANKRSPARKSLANSALSGFTAATSVMRRKSCPLATICVPTSTSTSPACTAASCSSSEPLRRVLSASMRAMRAPGSSAASCSSSRSVPRPMPWMSRLPHSGQARGTRSVKPQWWQRSVRSILWKTRQALQCAQPLFQPQAPQCSTGA